MGAHIEETEFSAEDFLRFKARLPEQLVALDRLLARPGFGEGPRSIGAELELFLVDAKGQAMPVGPEIASELDRPDITPELDRFEIELATPPTPLAGRPFSALGASIARCRGAIEVAAAARGARAVPVGILPTLRPRDLGPAAITNLPRYRALMAGLRRLRQSPFRICIDGDDPLEIMSDDGAMEGVNAAFQVHLRVTPAELAAVYNAALLATGAVMAAAVNSPTFLGHRLWHETRVALFKQAGDTRPPGSMESWRPPARINFGTGFMRDGAAEQFRESAALHEPLLPVVTDEDALAVVERGDVPALSELRMHHGTVWHWNRVVYDPAGRGHVRIELRTLPAGPTTPDMLANAAFLLGLTLDLAPSMGELLPGFPFAYAERNFCRAAQLGLDADLLWPLEPAAAPQPLPARQLLPVLASRARRGLTAAGVDADEADRHLLPFTARVEAGITAAAWQLQALAAAENAGARDRQAAVASMFVRYAEHAASNQPLHMWPPGGAAT